MKSRVLSGKKLGTMPLLPFLASIVCLIAWGTPSAGQQVYDTQAETVPKMRPDEAVATARLPDGFRMQAAAAEPDVRQPIGMAWDARGRLWVAENYTYAESSKKFDLELSDRILILEDADRDGVFESQKVFCENLKELTSIEMAEGGIWAMASPDLLFIPDADRDDVPDGPSQPIVTGFHTDIRHNFANGLRWGPDGWLYGRHGILGSSDVSVLDHQGQALSKARLHCGIWRYHPRRRTIEMVCEGTTNPWGMDWDAHGNLFFINTVIGHLWHAIPGAQLQRMYGESSDPDAYELLPQIADHVHWDAGSEDWKATRAGPPSQGTDAAGGGHAHSGMMIYQADQWPEVYVGDLFTLNLHGRRINRDRLQRQGAGFVGSHLPDMVRWEDPWLRGLELSAGPDGSVFVLDWSDIGECHDDDGIHRTSGRIYRIAYEGRAQSHLEWLAQLVEAERQKKTVVLSAEDAWNLLGHPNVWYSRQLLIALSSRAATLPPPDAFLEVAMHPHNAAKKLETSSPSWMTADVLQLRTLWALNASGNLPTDALLALLDSEQHEAVQSWSVRLLADRYSEVAEAEQTSIDAAILSFLQRESGEDSNSLPLLTTASLLPHFKHSFWEIALQLVDRGHLFDDRDFPSILWMGVKAQVASEPQAGANLARHSKIPKLTEWVVRRLASSSAGALALNDLVSALVLDADAEQLAACVRGLWAAYQGMPSVNPPAAWQKLRELAAQHADPATVEQSVLLQGIFEGQVAVDAIVALANDPAASPGSRRNAIRSLGQIEDASAKDALWRLVYDQTLGGVAAEALGQSLGRDEAERLVGLYGQVWPPAKVGIVAALGNRRESLAVLLDALERGAIPVAQVEAATWRQILSSADWDLLQRARALNPRLGVAEDKQAAIAAMESWLSEERLQGADASRGREVWNQVCASCHRLYGEGGQIGPELTGSQRTNRRYWIENILAPSAAVAENFRITAYQMDDGLIVTGVLLQETETTVTVQTAKEKVVLTKAEIAKERRSELSLMPEGLLDTLEESSRADLFRYLMGPGQVPLKP